MEQFRNKRVLIMGLGLHGGGMSAARFFGARGADVTVTDLKDEAALQPSIEKLKDLKIAYHLGGHFEDDFRSAEIVIKNPGVRNDSPYLHMAREAGAQIESDIGIFFALCPTSEIIGVTGTKGKSTTTTIIASILEEGIKAGSLKKRKVVVGGNIRTSVLEVLPTVTVDDIVVLELSSQQLEDLAPYEKSPRVAVLTSIFADHLNRYGSMGEYIEAKRLIFKFQSAGDHVFAPESLSPIVAGTPSQVHLVPPLPDTDAHSELPYPLSTTHYRSAVALAEAVAAFYGVGEESAHKAFQDFSGLEGRLEVIGEKNGVRFINDTTATTPGAAIAALESFPAGTIVLIAGGEDKALDFKEFAKAINERVKQLVLLPGTATDKLLNEPLTVAYEKVGGMEDAVSVAAEHTAKGDIVLLSPGAASFNLFKHEFDRGEVFKNHVQAR